MSMIHKFRCNSELEQAKSVRGPSLRFLQRNEQTFDVQQ
jgi:hypothetical protein